MVIGNYQKLRVILAYYNTAACSFGFLRKSLSKIGIDLAILISNGNHGRHYLFNHRSNIRINHSNRPFFGVHTSRHVLLTAGRINPPSRRINIIFFLTGACCLVHRIESYPCA